MSRERCIVVGAGGISALWFKAIKAEKVKVLAVVDLLPEKARQRIAEFELEGTEAVADLSDAIKRHQPDFVVDLTGPEAHCGVTCTALKAGCPVIGEKPMAASMAQARQMVKTSEQTRKLYMVSQSRRWSTEHERVRRTVTGGRIGTLTTLNCDFYIGAHFGRFRAQMASPLILDMAIHHFDLARFMSGADPVSVYAHEFNPHGSWYKGDAAASCIFEMSNGVVFTYRGSWCSEGCHTSWNGDWRLIGDRGTLICEKDKPPFGEVVAGNEGLTWSQKPLVPAKAVVKFGGMQGGLREMLAYLRKGTVPTTECHDNIKSMAMVFAAIDSSRLGKKVKVVV